MFNGIYQRCMALQCLGFRASGFRVGLTSSGKVGSLGSSAKFGAEPFNAQPIPFSRLRSTPAAGLASGHTVLPLPV